MHTRQNATGRVERDSQHEVGLKRTVTVGSLSTFGGRHSDETDPRARARASSREFTQPGRSGGNVEERPLSCGQQGTKHVTQTLGTLGSKVAVAARGAELWVWGHLAMGCKPWCYHRR